MSQGHINPDPEALSIAREMQERLRPDRVILLGSRAAGDHRPDSDVDLMAVVPDEHGKQEADGILIVSMSHAAGRAQCDFGEALAVSSWDWSRMPTVSSCTCSTATAASSRPARPRPPRPSWTSMSRPSPSRVGSPRASSTTTLGWRWPGSWDGRRKRTQAFSELQSHHLFQDLFRRTDKGNDNGRVERMVGYARRNFLVPAPTLADRTCGLAPPEGDYGLYPCGQHGPF